MVGPPRSVPLHPPWLFPDGVDVRREEVGVSGLPHPGGVVAFVEAQVLRGDRGQDATSLQVRLEQLDAMAIRRSEDDHDRPRGSGS